MNEATSPVLTLSEKDKARFWAKVDTLGGPNACWLWTSIKFRGGHGAFTVGGRKLVASRISWMLINGQIPDNGSYHGVCVCHKCDVPACCNPDHLFLGTHQDNMRDRLVKGLVNHPRGDKHYSHAHPERVPRGEAQGGAKLTAEQVIKIRDISSKGEASNRQLSVEFGVSAALISNIINRKIWKHV